MALADSLLQPDVANWGFGSNLAIGDLDGDPFADLVVGAYVFRGSAAGIPSRSKSAADATVDGAGLGDVLDFDGDGIEDVVLSDAFGSYHLLRGRPGGPPSGSIGSVTTPIDEFAAGPGFAAGDIDGDGAEDFVRSPPNNQSLQVRIVYGPESPSDAVAAIALSSLAVALRRRTARGSG